MKIVLDTNCLLRAVPPKSKYHSILTFLHQGYYTLCYSNEILMEYEELLMRFYSHSLTYNILNFMINSTHALQVNPHYKWDIITTDQDDNKFVDCALNAGADYIVTNDKHFNILNKIEFPLIRVIDIDTFMNILTE